MAKSPQRCGGHVRGHGMGTVDAGARRMGELCEWKHMATDSTQDRWVTALLDIMRVSCSTASMEDILYAVSRKVIEATGATACNSFLFPERANRGQYCITKPAPPADWLVPDPPDRLAVEALETMRPIAVANCREDARCDQDAAVRFGICSALAFPLVFQGKAVAAGLCWFDEVDVVMGIARVAAMAVANAQLNQEHVRLAVAEERNRLSQELHDSVCQSLATAKLNLNLLLAAEELSPAVEERVREVIGIIGTGYADARDIIHSFRVAGVASADFPRAFKEYVSDFSARTGIRVVDHVVDDHFRLANADTLLQVSRIVGEALSNVRKHAFASQVVIASEVRDGFVVVTVEDDGIGFGGVPDGGAEGRFGLKIMHERARMVGGSLAVEGMERGGTRVTLRVPYR